MGTMLEFIERNVILVIGIVIFILSDQTINKFVIQYADTISVTFLYFFLFSLTDILFQKVYLSIRNPVKAIIEDHANMLKIIPKVEYFFAFSVAAGIISFLNHYFVPFFSDLITNSTDPWLIALIMFIALYLLVMNWFFPRFYHSLKIQRT